MDRSRPAPKNRPDAFPVGPLRNDPRGKEAAATKAATQRNGKKKKVVQDLHHLRDDAQGVGETLTADALSVIESTGLRAKKLGGVHKS